MQPAAQAEDEQDRLALAAPVVTSEEDVLRALQQEAEAQRDETVFRPCRPAVTGVAAKPAPG